jgi:hypothetical protein
MCFCQQWRIFALFVPYVPSLDHIALCGLRAINVDLNKYLLSLSQVLNGARRQGAVHGTCCTGCHLWRTCPSYIFRSMKVRCQVAVYSCLTGTPSLLFYYANDLPLSLAYTV